MATSETAAETSSNRAGISWRRVFQFRIRTVLVLMIFFGFATGLWIRHLGKYKQQQLAFDKISSFVTGVTMEPGNPSWGRWISDPNEFRDVTRLIFHGSPKVREITDEHLRHLIPMSRLRRLSLHAMPIGDKGISYLSHLTELDTLSLKHTRVTDEGLRHLASLPNLRHLQLSYSRVRGPGLEYLAALPNLEVLELDGLAIRTEDLAALQRLPRLRTLYLAGSLIDDSGPGELAKLPNLQFLKLHSGKLSSFEFVGSKSIQRLEVIANLARGGKSLVLDDLPNLTQATIHVRNVKTVSFDQLPSLTHLRLTNTRVSGTVTGLDRLPQLKDLNCSGTRMRGIVPQLAGHAELQVLDLKQCNLRDDGLAGLNSLPKLRHLNLSTTQLRVGEIKHLTGNRQLIWLDLSGVALGPQDFVELAKMNSLRDLRIASTNADDRSVASIATMKLQTLNLAGNSVSDASVPALAKLPLRELIIYGTRISAQGFSTLQSQMANGTVIRWSSRRKGFRQILNKRTTPRRMQLTPLNELQ